MLRLLFNFKQVVLDQSTKFIIVSFKSYVISGKTLKHFAALS